MRGSDYLSTIVRNIDMVESLLIDIIEVPASRLDSRYDELETRLLLLYNSVDDPKGVCSSILKSVVKMIESNDVLKDVIKFNTSILTTLVDSISEIIYMDHGKTSLVWYMLNSPLYEVSCDL